MNDVTVTFVVPAYNEEGNLDETVMSIAEASKGRIAGYEVIIINDCSRDRTGAIADELAAKDQRIRVVHNERNMGLGYNYIKGVELAECAYVMMVPGDNEILSTTIGDLLCYAGKADIVVPYTANYHVRKKGRILLSKMFTGLMNTLFGLQLKYYNGIVIHKSDLIKRTVVTTFGFAYQAEALIRLIRSGHSYIHAPMYLKERSAGSSKALHPRNVWRVVKTIFTLFWKIRIQEREKYAGPVIEVPEISCGAHS